ncbi:vasorin [Thamnophis elegans]|uniref:vasorin n=1 Tax=Thamnophis elegans TaxID=35005 RepID=UPI001376E43D|nr:vasorin [Thamnophis elegans]XP_032086187.1 vasorin [Thamnophis elegans]
MRLPLIWAVLLFQAGSLARGCPADCQCNQPQTVFCIARSSPAIPQGLPPDTAHLYMFESGLRTLSEDSFAGLPSLRLLDLSQNLLSRLPRNVFQPLPGLHNLDLSSNQLQEVTNESFHGLRLLERLYLDRNRLQSIHPAAFNSLENLLELKLQDNQLQTVPPLNLPTLLLLDISRNKIAALETGTFRVRSLESLKMAGLGLGSVDEELLQSLRNLHELDVSDNLLARVPGVLSQLPGLTRLSLAGNGLISQLRAEDFRQLQQLQELDISNLNLNGLPWDFFASFPRLRAVTAAENPFNCVCQMSWMVSWARLSKASLRRPEETRCHFPPKNAGRLLQQLEYADFGCPSTTSSTSTVPATSPKLPSPLPSSRPLHPEAGTAQPTTRPGGLTTMASPAPEGQPSPEARLCPPHACRNGGLCQPGPNRHPECLCPLGFTGLYCEVAGGQATSPPEPTQATQVAVRHVGSTSVKVDLQNYIRAKPQLKGIRLTYWNLSGPDKRPVTLSLPAALPEYTVRALKPNSSYHICIGALGDKAPQEEICVEAHTLHPTHQQHAPVTRGKGPDLPLVVAPSVAAVLLLLGVAVASSYYARQRRQRRKAQAAPGTRSPSPLELEGEKGDLVTQSPKTAASLSLEYEVPLMHPHFTGTAPPRAPGPSYF